MPPMYFWSPSELRNGVKDWKEITPEPLHKAVEALRKRLEENAWKAGEIMRQGCHPALHSGTADEARTISDGIKKLGYPALPTVDAGQTEPAVFTAYFDRCADLLAKEVRRTFSDLFEIASAQSALLSRDAVDWANLQTRVLVADESDRIPLWTKSACDVQPYDPADASDEAIYWRKWRAPRWFFMQPFANSPYDRITAWERMDEADSARLLCVVEDRFNQRLIKALDDAVDETHVLLAKRSGRAEDAQGDRKGAVQERAMERKEGPQAHRVTQAPAPATEVSGLGGTRFSVPKATQIPPDFRPYFPNELKPKTQVVFAEAIKKFPEQKQTLELCKYVISEMTSVFRAAVESGTMKADQVFSDAGMGGLLHSLLVYNCDRDNETFRLGQEARKSEEWLRLAREINEAKLHNHITESKPEVWMKLERRGDFIVLAEPSSDTATQMRRDYDLLYWNVRQFSQWVSQKRENENRPTLEEAKRVFCGTILVGDANRVPYLTDQELEGLITHRQTPSSFAESIVTKRWGFTPATGKTYLRRKPNRKRVKD